MLPPGHAAAGFLTAYSLLKITQPIITAHQTTTLFWLGALFGFMPDLDMFYAFFLEGQLTIKHKKYNHRRFYTHRPALWLVIGLTWYFLASSPFLKTIGLLLWLAPWSHFLLDSLDYGIMWLWPFSNKFYAWHNVEIMDDLPAKNFWHYWWKFLKFYVTYLKLTFWLELLILLITIIIVKSTYK